MSPDRELPPLERTDKPSAMLAEGQSLVMSSTLRPSPLPPLLTNGTMVLPEKSYCSKKEATGMGMVPHQLG